MPFACSNPSYSIPSPRCRPFFTKQIYQKKNRRLAVLPDRKRAPPPKASGEVHHYKFEMQHSHRLTKKLKKLAGWFWGFL